MSDQDSFNNSLLVVMKQRMDMLLRDNQTIKRHIGLSASGNIAGTIKDQISPIQVRGKLTETQKKIIECLRTLSNQNSYVSYIVYETGLSAITVRSNLEKLALLGKLEYKKLGKGNKSYVKLL